MKKSIFISLLITISLHTIAQTINGIVVDKMTNEKICFASIYFTGTFVGTSSNNNGEFSIKIIKNTSNPLTISAVGYYSYVLTDLKPNQYYNIYLRPKVHVINEVNVIDNSLVKKRKNNLEIFRNHFIGTTPNSSKCKILNEEDISFNYNSDKDTLKAFATKPILVENMALGYKFTYYLDKFEYIRKSNSTYFQGNIFFTDDFSHNNDNAEYYERKRNHSYRGSRMHFIRSLWNNCLVENSFKIRSNSTEKLTYDTIVFQENPITKFIINRDSILINYYSESSCMHFLDDLVYFEQDGFFDPQGLIWSGKMGTLLMADWLPYEYIDDYNLTKP